MEAQERKKELHLSVVSPFASYFEGEVSGIQVSTSDGLIGILPGHAPLLTFLGYGMLKFERAEGGRGYIVDGGFLEVNRDRVTVLANGIEELEAVDRERAVESLESALRTPGRSQEKQNRIEAARARLRYTRSPQ